MDLPSDGAELVTIRLRIRRSKSVSRMELRSVRMASWKAVEARRLRTRLEDQRMCPARPVSSSPVPLFHCRQRADHFRRERARDLLGIANRVVQHVG